MAAGIDIHRNLRRWSPRRCTDVLCHMLRNGMVSRWNHMRHGQPLEQESRRNGRSVIQPDDIQTVFLSSFRAGRPSIVWPAVIQQRQVGYHPGRQMNVLECRNVLLRIRGGLTRVRLALNVSFADSPSALSAAHEAAGLPVKIASAFFGCHGAS
jgi:hypothetical protein